MFPMKRFVKWQKLWRSTASCGVGEVLDGVSYYNDSIGTSPTRTANGTLQLYDRKIILIAGGYDKHIPYDALGSIIMEKVKTLILMGATADKIEAAVKAAPNY